MSSKWKHGSALIGAGALLFIFGFLLILLVHFGILANSSWLLPWVTTYAISAAGVLVGTVLLACGSYVRSTLEKFEQKMAELEEMKSSEEKRYLVRIAELERKKRLGEKKLRTKEMELGRVKEDAEIKEISLRLSRSQLERIRLKARKKERGLLRAKRKLEESNKRLNKIRELAKGE